MKYTKKKQPVSLSQSDYANRKLDFVIEQNTKHEERRYTQRKKKAQEKQTRKERLDSKWH